MYCSLQARIYLITVLLKKPAKHNTNIKSYSSIAIIYDKIVCFRIEEFIF